MPNMKPFKPLLLLTVGFLAAPACSLPAPKRTMNTGGMSGVTCADDMEDRDGAVTAEDGGGVEAGNNINNLVTPVSCAGVGPNPNAIDKYSQGYTQDPNGARQGGGTRSRRCPREDKIIQMRGVKYGTATNVQYTDIQRSEDTSIDSRLPLPRRLARHEPRRGHGRRASRTPA